MKILNIILKVLLCLILISPILGVLGVFPPPTPDLYNTPQAFAFINTLMQAKYINFLIALVFALAIILIATKRMAFAALILFPITLNIICFHAFLDGGLFTMGALMADALLLLNLYFVWQNRNRYMPLLRTF